MHLQTQLGFRMCVHRLFIFDAQHLSACGCLANNFCAWVKYTLRKSMCPSLGCHSYFSTVPGRQLAGESAQPDSLRVHWYNILFISSATVFSSQNPWGWRLGEKVVRCGSPVLAPGLGNKVERLWVSWKKNKNCGWSSNLVCLPVALKNKSKM